MATPKTRRKPVVTHAELLQKFNEVRSNFRDLLEPREELWSAFWKQCEVTLYETTIRVCEEATRKRHQEFPIPSEDGAGDRAALPVVAAQGAQVLQAAPQEAPKTEEANLGKAVR